MSAAAERRPITARELALVALAVTAFWLALQRGVHPAQELDGQYDPDTLVTFNAFDQDPSAGAVLGWYAGDGPNGMHTYRPLQYTMLRLEYAVFGRHVWPYQFVNLLLLCGCAAGVGFLMRACGVPRTAAALGGIATLAWPTDANTVVIEWICTRSELLCGLGCVWAAVVLVSYLDHGGDRRLGLVAGLMLLAFLAKEMALGIALAFLPTIACWRADSRRRWKAVAVVTGISLLWLGLFKQAESNMVLPPELTPPGHTFADLSERLFRSWGTSFTTWTSSVCRPLGEIVRMVLAGASAQMVFSGIFWKALAALLAWGFAIRCALARWPRWLLVWAWWNAVGYLPVMPLHDRYPWYLFIPDLLDRGLMVVFTAAVLGWADGRYSWQLRLTAAVDVEPRQVGERLLQHSRRLLAWWHELPPKKVEQFAWLGLLLAAVPHFHWLPLTEPLNRFTDVDGLMKLRGIAADPSLRAMFGYFIGDDPQRVHTFRPFPAATLWLEWHLWGFTRWPYLLSNMAWLLLTAGALRGLARRIGLAPWAAWLSAAWFLAVPTVASRAVTGLIATRHDVTCALAAILAMSALLDWLHGGERRRLAAWFGWSMLAYLSKEMAIALVPLSLGIGLIEHRHGASWRRIGASLGVALACAVIYVVWYRLAEANMERFDHPTHSFGGMLTKLTYAYALKFQNTLWHLCRPLGDVVRQLWAAGLLVLWSMIFWHQLLRLAVYVSGFVLLVRSRPRAVAMVFCWKLCCYAPVLPLHDIWSWYSYMPHMLDYLLPALFLDLLADTPRGRAWLAALKQIPESRLTQA